MTHESRWAIYYSPPADHPLWAAGCAWLGRAGGDMAGLSDGEHRKITKKPRRYGLHATLKPPMRLIASATGDDLRQRARTIAARHAPFSLELGVAELGDFLALRPRSAVAALAALAADCVQASDDLRAPPTTDEIDRRRGAHGMTARQRELLERWGYPYVLDTFRFHITLTDKLVDCATRARVADVAARHFAPALRGPVPVADLALWQEPAPGADFRLIERVPLTG